MIHDDTLAELRQLFDVHDATAEHHRARATSHRTDMEHHEAEAATHGRIAHEVAQIIETGTRPPGRDAAGADQPAAPEWRPGPTEGGAT